MQYGIVLKKKVSDKVGEGAILGFIHANDEEKARQAAANLQKAYTIVENKINKPRTILDIIE